MNVNPSRVNLLRAIEAYAAEMPDNAIMLDAGSGNGPYAHLFTHTHYESADFEKVDKPYAASTHVCDLADIPVENDRYDYVLLSQVLEHLPNPIEVLRELNRVTKPGGVILASAPFLYEEHEQPYDFYRYTQFAMREMFEKAGYEIESIDWLEGFFATSGYMCHMMASYLPLAPRHYGGGLIGYAMTPVALCARPMFLLASRLLSRLDLRHQFTAYGFPKNYIVRARKPDRHA
ncbi:class I SAM-dependent methyltransferase [Mucisphaera calidilacus]|uniref:Uncharacterized protein n=1 Tax=Mucisphaera calidilacus TaxID=2527982 RepID=A0A518BX71_9BACT|nr:class I SAM-dependent methyltransferase [Mucisphaera calidilacus]QDU71590.1 hypothetical protein Pan265_14420 [Mucisphaera calidilacus]